MGPGLNDATYLYFFLSIGTFEMTQIANFLKTMFCSRGILSLVLKSNAWFNCWLNRPFSLVHFVFPIQIM